MPRRARMYLPDFPYHIVQRGNNREEYKRLGVSQEKRCYNYRMLFNNHLDDVGISLIRKAAHYSQPIGDDRFKDMIEKKYGIKMGLTQRGRPKMIDEIKVVKI